MPNRAHYQVDSHEYSSFINSAIAAIDYALIKLPPSTDISELIAIIERGKRLCWLSRNPDDRWECLRSLGDTARVLAHALHYKHAVYQAAIAVGRQSVDIISAALGSYYQGKQDDLKHYDNTVNNRWQTYDVLAISLLTTGDREVSVGSEQAEWN